MSKKIDLPSITIEKLIVHDIPYRKKEESLLKPSYSEQESQLSDGLRQFFKDKVIQALISDKAFKICFSDQTNPSAKELILDIIQKKKEFVERSKEIAKSLFDIQIGINAAGILVIVFGKMNSNNVCILLKLERDQGAQLKLDPDTRSFNIEEVKDLMLTQKTKIYKVALFLIQDEFSVKYDGLIMDYQINIKNKKEATTFFIDKFLGCRAFEDPKITTQRFYNYTKEFIESIDDDILKAKYLQDLNSYIQKNIASLSPKDYAIDYITNAKDRNRYQEYLKTKNFEFKSFMKDTQLIENKIRKFAVLFENDITIFSSKGAFDKHVKLKRMDDGKTKAEIVSRIKKVS